MPVVHILMYYTFCEAYCITRVHKMLYSSINSGFIIQQSNYDCWICTDKGQANDIVVMRLIKQKFTMHIVVDYSQYNTVLVIMRVRTSQCLYLESTY